MKGKCMDLNEIRSQIDAVDDEMTALLAKRLQIVSQVAQAKKETGKLVRDPAREAAILKRIAERTGEEYAEYILTVYQTIFDVSCHYQEEIIRSKEERKA